jgi:hypothetical protein
MALPNQNARRSPDGKATFKRSVQVFVLKRFRTSGIAMNNVGSGREGRSRFSLSGRPEHSLRSKNFLYQKDSLMVLQKGRANANGPLQLQMIDTWEGIGGECLKRPRNRSQIRRRQERKE